MNIPLQEILYLYFAPWIIGKLKEDPLTGDIIFKF
jgi:hypothetical protein